MFVSKVEIKNFRLFSEEDNYKIEDFNVPDNQNEGTGLTVFVWENGCGKTSVLDAISLSMLEYKTETFNVLDMSDPVKNTEIRVYSDNPFTVKGTMPKGEFSSLGFYFKGGMRSRSSSSYLSTSVVCDQQYIKEDPIKPKDGSPDLRLSVNNPFSGKRFNETDLVYLDKNRLFQTRSGTYNSTRFDRIMEDFNFQYIKNSSSIENLNTVLNTTIKVDKVENESLAKAIDKFKEISDIKVQLDFIDNYKPFKNASFVIKKNKNIQIPLSSLGSGYEMIFSLIYSYYMAIQEDKKMIILIDEPELHLHPKIQEEFVKFLLEISKNAQVIITTHSPLLMKQLAYNTNVKTIVLNKDKTIVKMQDRKLPYISVNETNYLAFNLVSEEYHNELYEELLQQSGETRIKDFDNNFFINTKGEVKMYPWMGHPNEVSLHTFLRNQIHHQAENGKANPSDLKLSINKMRSYL